MVCKYCGGDVDDPMWDDVCRECEHEMYHDQGSRFEPACDMCIGEAEDHYEQGQTFNGKEWIYA